jgi:hypothetical protein
MLIQGLASAVFFVAVAAVVVKDYLIGIFTTAVTALILGDMLCQAMILDGSTVGSRDQWDEGTSEGKQSIARSKATKHTSELRVI